MSKDEHKRAVEEKGKEMMETIERSFIKYSPLLRNRDMELVEKYLNEGITLDQIIELNLAIDVCMPLTEGKFRVVQ